MEVSDEGRKCMRLLRISNSAQNHPNQWAADVRIFKIVCYKFLQLINSSVYYCLLWVGQRTSHAKRPQGGESVVSWDGEAEYPNIDKEGPGEAMVA